MQPESNEHVFHKGIKDGLDPSKLGNDTWTFPTLNVRLLNKKEQGYIVTPEFGNTINDGTGNPGGVNNTGAALQITPGYVILGANEFNGVLYIVSTKNDNSGQGEIGCYPAPNCCLPSPFNTGVGGFPTETTIFPNNRFYAPLQNFVTLGANAQIYSITVAYPLGSYVISPVDGNIYICTTATSGVWNAADWTLFEYIYQPADTYVVGNICIYNGYEYICNTNTSSPAGAFDYSLWNINSSMNSSLFSFSLSNKEEVECRPHYDGSINLYLCDYLNPNRVINVGFDQNGTPNNFTYNVIAFNSTMLHIIGASKSLLINSVNIISGGYHKFGNYFFYLRYMNASMDATDVIIVSNACQIYDGDMAHLDTVQGGNGTTAISPYSGKKVILNLDVATIDTTYMYIDVVWMRFYSDVITDVQIWEVYEIEEPFLISDILATGGAITILGDEDTIDMDSGTLLTIKGIENICKSQTQIGNRWWGGNWKGPELHDDSLTTFANLIKITYDDLSVSRYGGSLTPNRTSSAFNIPGHGASQYRDYTDTYNYVGYFRGEPYCFMVVFEFQNGQESQAYPMTGQDEIDPSSPQEINTSGRYRFPDTDHSPAYINDNVPMVGNTGGGLRLLGVKMDTSLAVTYLNSLPIGSYLRSQIRGMYFVRAERNPVLKYQGLMMPLSMSYLCKQDTTPVEFTTGKFGTCLLSEYDPISAGPAVWITGQTGNDNWTSLNQDGSTVCSTDPTYSLGQFHGKFIGSTASGALQYSCNWWGADHRNGNEETGGSLDSSMSYKDLYFPVYRGYMPMIYYRGDTPHSRYYQSRWFYKYNNYAFYSPDALLDDNHVDIVDGNSYYYKRVAVTDADVPGGVRWKEFGPATWGANNDLVPNKVLVEMSAGYLTGGPYVKGSEQCLTYDINGQSPASHPSVTGYLNSADDFTNANNGGVTGNELSLTQKTINHQWWSNRSILTTRYIGVKTTTDTGMVGSPGQLYDNYRLAITNMYNQPPERTKGFTLVSIYPSIYTLPLYKISEYIPLYDINNNVILGNSYTCWKGDCFLQRFYFRQLTWNCSSFSGNGNGGTDGGGSSKQINCGNPEQGPYWDDPNFSNNDKCNNRYPHGLVMGIVIEMKYNGSMRFQEDTVDFYPHIDAYGFNFTAPGSGSQGAYESWMQNTGHMRTLDEMSYFAYNPNVINPKNIHLTRIRYSDEHIQYAPLDGYRNLMPLNYKDFDSSYNQIMKIGNFKRKLISIQQDVINEHYILVKDIKADITSGDIVLGTGDILSDMVNVLAFYGTRHQWSVYFASDSIYGVDAPRRLIWRVRLNTAADGTNFMSSGKLSSEKAINKWVYDILTAIDERTDMMVPYPDTPALGLGISTGFNPKYNDVIFSFMNYQALSVTDFNIQGITQTSMYWNSSTNYTNAYWIVYNQADEKYYYSLVASQGFQPNLYPLKWRLIDFSTIVAYDNGKDYALESIVKCCDSLGTNGGSIYILGTVLTPGRGRICSDYNITVGGNVINMIPINCCTDTTRTIVFNEDTDEFTGEVDYGSSTYLKLYNDFFTTGNNGMWADGYVWRHEQPDMLWFYGGDKSWMMTFYENGNSEKGSLSAYTKYYESQDVHEDENNLFEVDYETEYQQGSVFPFINKKKFWSIPEYLEHHWKIPIPIQSSSNKQAFNTNSSMQGTWLKTTLRYKGRISMFVKNVITYFRISKA